MAGQGRGEELPRGLGIALCVTSLVWAAAATLVSVRSAAGMATRFHLEAQQHLIESGFLLFLVVVGFEALDWLATRGVLARPSVERTLALPRRKSAGREWLVGAAVGWGMCLLALLPALLSRHLHVEWNHGAAVAGGALTTLITLLLATLAEEAIFRGYPFRMLTRAIGPAWASVLLSLAFAAVLMLANAPLHPAGAMLNLFLFGVLLSVAYLRTHALWMGWGLHFAFRAVMVVLFGLPVAGLVDFASLADGSLYGRRWLTGGGFGLDAAFPTLLVMLVGIAVVYRLTREWAWAYTHREIFPAGYEVTVAPPAAHVALEKAATPPPLVQIMSVAPPPPLPTLPRDPERES